MSVASTLRLSFTSPRKMPMVAEALTVTPFTVGSEIVMRLLSDTGGSETMTSWADMIGVRLMVTELSS